MKVLVDVWEDTKIDGGEYVGRFVVDVGPDLLTFMIEKFDAGLHLNIRQISDEELRSIMS